MSHDGDRGTAGADTAGGAAGADTAGGAAGADGLEPFRHRLDAIDEEIAKLFGERLQICREVAVYKSEHGIPMMQPERVRIVRERYLSRGAEHELPEQFSAELFELLIGTTCRLEDELMDELATRNGRDAA